MDDPVVTEEVLALKFTLTHLIDALSSSLKILQGDAKDQVESALHDSKKLPNKEILGLANTATDLLHDIQKLLDPGPLVLADYFLGYTKSKCLSAAVKLSLPDALATKPLSLSELAEAAHARPDRLQQVLRVLTNDGIFAYDPEASQYSNSRVSCLLASDHPAGWHRWVELYGSEFYDMARGIPAACNQDATRSPAQINYDTDQSMFEYFKQMGWIPRLQQTLGAGATAQAPGILADYPWEQIADGEVLDIGGGAGALVALLLREHKSMRGAILDLSNVIAVAKDNFHSKEGMFYDVGDRVSSLIIGDFLQEVPAFNYYTIKWCLHDWDDLRAIKILTNVRRAIRRGPKSRLIVLESILADGYSSRLSRYADLNMWMAANGQERTEEKWRLLAEKTGWKLTKVYPLRNAWPCAIELIPNYQFVASSVDENQDADSNQEITSSNQETQSGTDCLTNGNNPAFPSQSSASYETTMSFLEPWLPSYHHAPFYRSSAAPGYQSINFRWQTQTIRVTDARPQKDSFTLDTHGFAYLSDPVGLPSNLQDALRAGSHDLVAREYYPLVERLLKSFTAASRTVVFDHTLRKRDPALRRDANPDGREQPATTVHCDQGPRGARRRLKMHLTRAMLDEGSRRLGSTVKENEKHKGDGNEEGKIVAAPEEETLKEVTDSDISNFLSSHRVQILNVWRPLNGPVRDWPLAQMDASSLAPEDSHRVALWRGSWEDRGETMTFTHAPGQRWYYLDGHGVDEVTVLKIWDSWGEAAEIRTEGERTVDTVVVNGDNGFAGQQARKMAVPAIAPCCPHAAFEHPMTPSDAAPRESVEVRCIVVY